MKQTKMSLENLKGKLSRTEMKNIMAGDAPGESGCSLACNNICVYTKPDKTIDFGNCYMPNQGPNAGRCFCVGSY